MKKSTLLLAFCMSALGSTAQITDPGFENWATDNLGYQYPTDWESLTGAAMTPTQSYWGTVRDTIAPGNYALQLSRWYNYTWDIARQTRPINYRPASLTGKFRYTENQLQGNEFDQGLVMVFVTATNQSTMQPDTIGFGFAELDTTQTFSNFTCPITYSSTAPAENISIVISPTKWINSAMVGVGSFCSFLTVDDLALTPETVSGIADAVPGSGIVLYPNPAKGNVTIKLNNHTKAETSVQVLDMQGRLVRQKTVPAGSKNATQISLIDLPAGLYSVKVVSDKNVWTGKLVVE